MSLSAFLLGASDSKPNKVVDTDLDALFRSSVSTEFYACNQPSDDSEEVDPSQLVHESVAKPTGKSSRNPKSKHVPEDETADQRDRRTIFVGNLSVEVAQKRVRVIILLFFLTV